MNLDLHLWPNELFRFNVSNSGKCRLCQDLVSKRLFVYP
ncbi:hypothetical protein M758_5G035800 [Ceratodon purpureus]|uniref:Uncharacterized protein n=1 Tax=Ceratodon purpureus TaxID=3225 RepID=A0A8T0HXN8_CERPU|nr:hypothetical protein KC19_5G035900 [Ceratodon purpureus]KAG0615370.1 hypothetical protein M758_5G035800 [Ceratodon purpureus]